MNAITLISTILIVVVIALLVLVALLMWMQWKTDLFDIELYSQLEASMQTRREINRQLEGFADFANAKPFRRDVVDLQTLMAEWQSGEQRLRTEFNRLHPPESGALLDAIISYAQWIMYFSALNDLWEQSLQLREFRSDAERLLENLNNIPRNIYHIVQTMCRTIEKIDSAFSTLQSRGARGLKLDTEQKVFRTISAAMDGLPASLKDENTQLAHIPHDAVVASQPIVARHKDRLDEMVVTVTRWLELVYHYRELTFALKYANNDLKRLLNQMPGNVDVKSAENHHQLIEKNIESITNESRSPDVGRLEDSIQQTERMIENTKKLVSELKQAAEDYQMVGKLASNNSEMLDALLEQMHQHTRQRPYPIIWGWAAREQESLTRKVEANTVMAGIFTLNTIAERLATQQAYQSEITRLSRHIDRGAALHKNLVAIIKGNEHVFDETWLATATTIGTAVKSFHKKDFAHIQFLRTMDVTANQLRKLKSELRVALKDRVFQESELVNFSKMQILRLYAKDIPHFVEWIADAEQTFHHLTAETEQLTQELGETLQTLQSWEDTLHDEDELVAIHLRAQLSSMIEKGQMLLQLLNQHEKPMKVLRSIISEWQKECVAAGAECWQKAYREYEKAKSDLRRTTDEIAAIASCSNESVMGTARSLLRKKVKKYPNFLFSDNVDVLGKDSQKITTVLQTWREIIEINQLLRQTVYEPILIAYQPVEERVRVVEDQISDLRGMVDTDGYPDSSDVNRWHRQLEYQRNQLQKLQRNGRDVRYVKSKFTKIFRELDKLSHQLQYPEY